MNGGSAQPFEQDGQNDLTVDAGTYTVTEPGAAGYTTSYEGCEGIQLPVGGTATCTITNDDEPAHLIVKKVVVNDNGGTKTASDFSFQVNGGQPQQFEQDGQNDVPVDAGQYTVTEPGTAGYTTTYQGCDHILLAIGETATCTITNNDVPHGQGSISVSKSADPTSIKEPGGPVTFSVRVTNTSADVNVVVTNVVDDKFGDLDDDGGSGCFDVPFNLAPGASASCQFTEPVTGPGGTTHVDTVTASGQDANGNPVSASDSAEVVITPKLIDLVVTKQATSPTKLHGTVHYALTVTNKGPDQATNVQLADPAPAGITYLTATSSQGTCTVAPALVTCSLGTLASGQTVTIAITGRSDTVGSHTNTATVTGAGGARDEPGRQHRLGGHGHPGSGDAADAEAQAASQAVSGPERDAEDDQGGRQAGQGRGGRHPRQGARPRREGRGEGRGREPQRPDEYEGQGRDRDQPDQGWARLDLDSRVSTLLRISPDRRRRSVPPACHGLAGRGRW